MKNWIKVKLVDISNPRQWKNLPISELTETGFPVYGANGIIGKYKEYNHEFPTLTITCRGATCGTINITEPKAYITSNAMALDDLSKDIDQNFLYYALIRRGSKDIISGSAQPQITREGLSKIVLTIPKDKEDQIRIASLLDKSKQLISLRIESLALLDIFLKSTFDHLFKTYRSKNITPLESIADITSGLTKGKRYGDKQTLMVPYMRVANVQDGFLDLNEIKQIEATKEEAARYNLLYGDLLLTEGGDPDKLGRGTIWKNEIPDCIFQNHIFRVRINDTEKVNPRFLSYLTSSSYGKKYFLKSAKQTTGIASINSTQLKSFPVFIPPSDLQNQFALIVEKIDSLKVQYQHSLQELENLYGSLGQKAFKGELDLSKLVVEYDESKQPDENKSASQPKDVTEMSLDDFYGIPEEIQQAYGSIEQNVFDWEFFFKKHFANRPITTEEAHKLYHSYNYERGYDFDYEEFAHILFETLKKTNTYLQQQFNPLSKQIEITVKNEASQA